MTSQSIPRINPTLKVCEHNRIAHASVAPVTVFSLYLGFFCFIWGSGVFIENLGFFSSGQIFVNGCRITVFSIQEALTRHSNLSLICQGLFVHEFGMLCLVLKMLWLKISSLFYGRTDCDMNVKF